MEILYRSGLATDQTPSVSTSASRQISSRSFVTRQREDRWEGKCLDSSGDRYRSVRQRSSAEWSLRRRRDKHEAKFGNYLLATWDSSSADSVGRRAARLHSSMNDSRIRFAHVGLTRESLSERIVLLIGRQAAKCKPRRQIIRSAFTRCIGC